MELLGAILVVAVAVTVAGASYVPPRHHYYCPEPRAPQYGSYRSGKQDYHYRPGHIIYYACDDGYRLYGHSRSECYYDSTRYRAYWRYPAPVCKPIDCGGLEDPDYGDVKFRSTTFKSKATYSCNDGFVLVGDRTRVCQYNGKWSGDAPVCKPVDCGDLEDPDYGNVDFSSTTFWSKATYSCKDGFFLVGKKIRICQANGKWSGDAPVCKPVDCGRLKDPKYGDVRFRSTTFRSKATYSCRRGFVLVGVTTRVCQANKQWSGDAPVCKPVDCGDLDDPKYGDVDFTTTTFRSKATYSCNKGFLLVGVKIRVCQANGKWSRDAPVCKPIDCGDLEDPDYGSVDFSSTTFWSKATYSCRKGFILVGDKTRICQANGKWSGDAPVCKPVDCGDLEDPDYGSVDFSSTTFWSKATYSCRKGFILVGDKTRICQATGKWSGDAPVCKPVDCGDLEDPDYGSVSFKSTTFRSKATYSCNDGFFLVGDKTRVCQANGKWSGEAPVCKPVDCGDLDDPDYGSVDFSSTTFRSKATYSCNKGFTLVGDKTRVCQANGNWSGDAPVCKRVGCGDLPDPDYGYVRLSGTRVGSKATYFCKKGFWLVGSSTRVCQYNGEWSGEAPRCKRRTVVDCGDLSHPTNGWVVYPCKRVGCHAYYSCIHNHRIQGNQKRVCQDDGHWSGDEPSCEISHKHYGH